MGRRFLPRCRAAAWLAVVLWSALAWAQPPGDQLLRERQEALSAQLQHSIFGRPLVIESTQRQGTFSGEAYALLPQPFAAVSAGLARPARWCDMLMLHLNVKHCAATPQGLSLHLGRKFEEPLDHTYRLEFEQAVLADTPAYLSVQLNAARGPLGTGDYRLLLEAVPAAGGASFIHFTYSVSYGTLARLMMRGYVSTVGSGKIGFSTEPAPDGGAARPVRGERGAVERNTMRYYLAIETYLDSLSQPPDERVERRLRAWFDATERYKAQLHEMDREEYLAMKRNELRRTQSLAPGAGP